MRKLNILLMIMILVFISGCDGEGEGSSLNIEKYISEGIDTVEVNSQWEDAGAYILVNGESMITAQRINDVFVSVIGLHPITYVAYYEGVSFVIIRYVMVVDQTPPVIILTPGIDTITFGTDWIDAGCTATDNYDETIACDVVAYSALTAVGEYTITYSVTDSSGNITTALRYVNILE